MEGWATQICPVGVVDYIESPTATNLRDALLELYLMEAYVAPAPPAPSEDKFEDIGDDKWTGVDGDDFEDYQEG